MGMNTYVGLEGYYVCRRAALQVSCHAPLACMNRAMLHCSTPAVARAQLWCMRHCPLHDAVPAADTMPAIDGTPAIDMVSLRMIPTRDPGRGENPKARAKPLTLFFVR